MTPPAASRVSLTRTQLARPSSGPCTSRPGRTAVPPATAAPRYGSSRTTSPAQAARFDIHADGHAASDREPGRDWCCRGRPTQRVGLCSRRPRKRRRGAATTAAGPRANWRPSWPRPILPMRALIPRVCRAASPRSRAIPESARWVRSATSASARASAFGGSRRWGIAVVRVPAALAAQPVAGVLHRDALAGADVEPWGHCHVDVRRRTPVLHLFGGHRHPDERLDLGAVEHRIGQDGLRRWPARAASVLALDDDRGDIDGRQTDAEVFTDKPHPFPSAHAHQATYSSRTLRAATAGDPVAGGSWPPPRRSCPRFLHHLKERRLGAALNQRLHLAPHRLPIRGGVHRHERRLALVLHDRRVTDVRGTQQPPRYKAGKLPVGVVGALEPVEERVLLSVPDGWESDQVVTGPLVVLRRAAARSALT